MPTCPEWSGYAFGSGWHWQTLFAGLVCAFVARFALAHSVMGAVAVRLILQVCGWGATVVKHLINQKLQHYSHTNSLTRNNSGLSHETVTDDCGCVYLLKA